MASLRQLFVFIGQPSVELLCDWLFQVVSFGESFDQVQAISLLEGVVGNVHAKEAFRVNFFFVKQCLKLIFV